MSLFWIYFFKKSGGKWCQWSTTCYFAYFSDSLCRKTKKLFSFTGLQGNIHPCNMIIFYFLIQENHPKSNIFYTVCSLQFRHSLEFLDNPDILQEAEQVFFKEIHKLWQENSQKKNNINKIFLPLNSKIRYILTSSNHCT